jgi:hypothetical protein
LNVAEATPLPVTIEVRRIVANQVSNEYAILREKRVLSAQIVHRGPKTITTTIRAIRPAIPRFFIITPKLNNRGQFQIEIK